jgi:hypothetical protein
MALGRSRIRFSVPIRLQSIRQMLEFYHKIGHSHLHIRPRIQRYIPYAFKASVANQRTKRMVDFAVEVNHESVNSERVCGPQFYNQRLKPLLVTWISCSTVDLVEQAVVLPIPAINSVTQSAYAYCMKLIAICQSGKTERMLYLYALHRPVHHQADIGGYLLRIKSMLRASLCNQTRSATRYKRGIIRIRNRHVYFVAVEVFIAKHKYLMYLIDVKRTVQISLV